MTRDESVTDLRQLQAAGRLHVTTGEGASQLAALAQLLLRDGATKQVPQATRPVATSTPPDAESISGVVLELPSNLPR